MMTTTHALVEEYLRRLDNAARSLPRQQRQELVGEIREHLDAGLSPHSTEAEVRNVLDGLGAPSEIVTAAQPEGRVVKRGAREAFAVAFLLLGFPPFLGWIIGLALLLWSPLWSARQKLLGALIWPGGLMTVALAAAAIAAMGRPPCSTTGVPVPVGGTPPTTVTTVVEACTNSGISPWALLAIAAVVAAPVVVAAYLYRAAGRKSVAA
jgi:hypothetical protein